MPTSRVPTLGRSIVIPKSNSRPVTFSSGKSRSQLNGSILSFFKKAPPTSTLENINLELHESLFIEDDDFPKAQGTLQTPTPPRDSESIEGSPETKRNFEDDGMLRFNEEPGSVKRQRVEGPPTSSPSSQNPKGNLATRKGPFFEESDDDDEDHTIAGETFVKSEVVISQPISLPRHESTKTEGKSEFENIEDFIDDEFPEEGEEYIERKWMEEYGEMEPGLEDTGLDDSSETRLRNNAVKTAPTEQETFKPVCPVCGMNFDGLTDQVR